MTERHTEKEKQTQEDIHRKRYRYKKRRHIHTYKKERHQQNKQAIALQVYPRDKLVIQVLLSHPERLFLLGFWHQFFTFLICLTYFTCLNCLTYLSCIMCNNCFICLASVSSVSFRFKAPIFYVSHLSNSFYSSYRSYLSYSPDVSY